MVRDHGTGRWLEIMVRDHICCLCVWGGGKDWAWSWMGHGYGPLVMRYIIKIRNVEKTTC